MVEFATHSLESAPVASKRALEAAVGKIGFLPNILGDLAESPAALNGYMGLQMALDNDGTLSPAERQLVMLSISAFNGCTYCVPAHSAGGKMAGLAEDVIDAVRAGTPVPDSRLRALHEFATALVQERGQVGEVRLRAFLDAGFSKDQALEVIAVAAVKTITNYTHQLTGTALDDELTPFKWSERQVAAE